MNQTQTETDSQSELDASRMPFMGHLAELRKRLMISALAAGIGFGICYPFKERLLAFMIDPLKAVLPPGQRLIYTNLPEAFFTYLKICFLAGGLLALPVVFLQIWRFIAPGLYKKERKFAFGFVISSTVLFLGGAIFGYQVVFPFGFKFFVGFESELITPLPALKAYLSFSVRLLLAFGAIFELPIVIFFLAKMGLVTDKFLRKNRKWALLLTFVTGAIFTPPDVVTQVLMALPLIILFEISIFVAKAFGPKAKPDKDDEQDGDSPDPGPDKSEDH
ncbi:MAG: twin-arginine translocase subunit TatC [Deltaproteobacteria bacterium]|nr:twin-arginine translocase subunit TatC [Deltaproteobacteria bacterium]